MRALLLAIRHTARLGGSQRKLWLPFLVVAFLEVLLLSCVWVAPHPPFSKLLAPPIRYFFGDRILHYPWHLWFLYHVMKHTHLVASTLVGAFLSGLACAMVRQTHEGRALSVHGALVSKQVRYGTLVIVWLATWGLAKGLSGAVVSFGPNTIWTLWVNVGLSVLIQTMFVYAIPAAVFEGSPWWKALWQSLREVARYPLSTSILVGIPSAAVLLFALTASPAHVAHWMQQGTPEIALVWVMARLIIWTATDAVMTVGIAHLWWCHRMPRVVAAAMSTASGVATGSVSRPITVSVKEDPVVA